MARGPENLRIVLVQPPKEGGVQSLFTFHKNEGIGAKPPLGILSLATYLRSAGFSATACLDAQADGLSPEATVERIAAYRPDVVGVSVWTDFWFPAWSTMQGVRRAIPECTIIAGGPHCLIYPRETLETSGADYVVAGDGEDTLLALAQCLASGAPAGDLPGLWRQQGLQSVAPAEAVATIADLDHLPLPDRTLLPRERYTSVLGRGAFETTLISSRGCPHRCVFCKMHAQRVAVRSAGRVVDEFEQIAALGITELQVYDDTFTWSRRRVMDICHGIIEKGIRLRWAIRDRVDRADSEVFAWLRRAGCERIHFGVESGSPRILEASGKRITLDQAERALRLAHEAGFTTLAYYMFGFPGETRADARQTMVAARRLNSDYAVFAVLIPYPGTELYERALADGTIPTDFWAQYARQPQPDFRVPHLCEQHLSRETLIALKDQALRAYYLRPRRLWRELRGLRSWREVRCKAGMAMNIVSDGVRSAVRRCGGRRAVARPAGGSPA